MGYREDGTPRCDMDDACERDVTYIGEKGWIYCATHAIPRRYWERTRKMRPHELNRIRRGEPLDHY